MSDITLYATIEHLILHYRRIDLLLQSYSATHISSSFTENSFPGLVIDKKEFDNLFVDSDTLFEEKNTTYEEALIKHKEFCTKINQFQVNAHNQELTLRLLTLEDKFQLNPIERDILLLALAPEIDRKYEKIFGYIQDDITRKMPCVDLVLSLFFPSFRDRLRARTLFDTSAPLLYHKFIELKNDPSRPETPFTSQIITINKGISNHLLGSDNLDPILAKSVNRITPRARLEDLVLTEDVKSKLDTLFKCTPNSKVIYLQGSSGTGRKTIGEALCSRWCRNLLFVEEIPRDLSDIDLFTQLLCREAILSDAVLFIHNIVVSEYISQLTKLITWVKQYNTTLIICGENNWEPGSLLPLDNFFTVSIPLPSSCERYRIWDRLINGKMISNRDSLLTHVAATFNINGKQINDALSTAIRNAYRRDPENVSVTEQDLFTACRTHSSPLLSKHAHKISAQYCWEDIILPEEKIEQLKELCSSIRYHSVVFEDWGYNSKLSLGKGTQALFAGPSGTGKTMAAEIIASELGLELYKIDLSSIVSKYIGETEKNLSQIFDEAEKCNVILFFDEADALMGKRSEVKDAHDRYANIEISYLLQRMEEFNGMSLLATNLRKNIDDAFIRRIRYIVEFPFPDPVYRKKIWEKIWPPHAPLSPETDFDFLSYQFELSGGNIRNIALNASFTAAEKQKPIAMPHILVAVKREFQKMGKVFLDENFGPYRDFVNVQRQVETI